MYVDYRLIGKRIKERRRQKGKTQEQLAEAISVTVGYVSQLERGYSKINLEMLAKICGILDCDMSDIIMGTAQEYSSYKNSELVDIISGLSSNEKSLVLDIIEAILKNRKN